MVSGCTLWKSPTPQSPAISTAPPVAQAPPPTRPSAAPSPPAAPPAPAAAPAPAAPPAPPKPVPTASSARKAGKPSAPTLTSRPSPGPSGPAPAVVAPVKPAAPSLDLASLEQRLKDTKAIGVFTKLSLKNQVDDLLEDFRKYHQAASSSPPPPSLRSQYDLLMIKVLPLLQDGDPQLASTIASSREALWDILKDPIKFAKI